MSDEQLRAIWLSQGGTFHGPNIETATMPESDLLIFLRQLYSMAQKERTENERLKDQTDWDTCPDCGCCRYTPPQEQSNE